MTRLQNSRKVETSLEGLEELIPQDNAKNRSTRNVVCQCMHVCVVAAFGAARYTDAVVTALLCLCVLVLATGGG